MADSTWHMAQHGAQHMAHGAWHVADSTWQMVWISVLSAAVVYGTQYTVDLRGVGAILA